MDGGAGAPLRIGIVGCGRVAVGCHIRALRSPGEVRIVSVADPDDHRRDHAAALLGIDARYRDVTELLAGVPVDAVGVCVPSGSHADIVIEALAAGRHVLVEKPLAQTSQDCDRIVAAAASTGLTTAVGFNYRSHRLIRQARRVLETGALGPLVMIETSLTDAALRRPDLPEWRRTQEMDSMLEKGVHQFDLWRLLGGGEVTTLVALEREDGQGDATAGLLARLDSGTICLTGLSGDAGTGHVVSLCGSERRLDIHLEPPNTLTVVTAGRPRRMTADRLAGLAGSVRGSSPTVLTARRRDLLSSYAGEWEDFAQAIRQGRAPAATLDDGRAAVTIALAATRSLAERARVAVSPATSSPA